MTKREREEAFNDYATRSVRELAALVVEADEAIERRDAKIAGLRRALEAMILNGRSHKDCPRSLPSLPIAQAEAALRAARSIL